MRQGRPPQFSGPTKTTTVVIPYEWWAHARANGWNLSKLLADAIEYKVNERVLAEIKRDAAEKARIEAEATLKIQTEATPQ